MTLKVIKTKGFFRRGDVVEICNYKERKNRTGPPTPGFMAKMVSYVDEKSRPLDTDIYFLHLSCVGITKENHPEYFL